MDYAELFAYLLIFGLILVATYYATRFISLKASKVMQSRHLKVIETISLGTDKKLLLIKTGEKYLLISSSGKNIQYITDVQLEEEVDMEENDSIKKMDFSKILNYIYKVKEKIEKKDVDKIVTINQSEPNRFKENLESLKKINKDLDRTGGPE